MTPNEPSKTAAPYRASQTSWQNLWSISWPIILANITMPLVGAVDTAMMGRLPDPAFIGGVALGSLVFNVLYFGFGFLRMCTTGLVAQAHGRQDWVEIENLLIRGLVVALAVGITALLLSPFIQWVSASVLSASDQVEGLMRTYVEIRLFAAPAAFANLVLLGCLFGRQQMRLCMVQMLFVNIANLLLNYLFVIRLGMKVEGVALASVVAQWAGLVFTLGLVGWSWRPILRGVFGRLFRRNPAWFDLAGFAKFFTLGFDLVLRTLVLLGCEALFLNMAARNGDLDLAAAQLVIVLFSMISYGLDGFAHAAEALVGEAIGRKDPGMLRLVIRRTNWMAFGASVLTGLCLALAEMPIIRLLTDQAELMMLVAAHWYWVALIPVASFLGFQMDGVFIGAILSRDMRNAMLIAAAIFIILIWVLTPYGLAGLMAAFTVYQAVRGISMWVRMPRVYRLVEN